jgi:hypothetical protein
MLYSRNAPFLALCKFLFEASHGNKICEKYFYKSDFRTIANIYILESQVLGIQIVVSKLLVYAINNPVRVIGL